MVFATVTVRQKLGLVPGSSLCNLEDEDYYRVLFAGVKQIMNKLAPFLIIGLSFLVAFLTLHGNYGLKELNKVNNELEFLEQENVRLQNEILQTKDNIDRLRRDRLFLEKKAREELSVARPNDLIYVLPRAEGGSSRQ